MKLAWYFFMNYFKQARYSCSTLLGDKNRGYYHNAHAHDRGVSRSTYLRALAINSHGMEYESTLVDELLKDWHESR